MAVQLEDPDKLRKIARVTLGYEEEDDEDDDEESKEEKKIPDFYLPLLLQYLQTNPYDTNFIVEFAEKGKPSRGGNGFGAITCMEGYCWRDINLDADPDRPEGGRKDGFGSFYNYQQHCLDDPNHKKGRDERLKKKGIHPPPVASLGGPSTFLGARASRPSASFQPLSPVDTNQDKPSVKSERVADTKPVLSAHNSLRDAIPGISSDPIYITDDEVGSDDDDSGVQALEASQIPVGMRKKTNRDNPVVLSDEEDEPSSSARQSARSAVAPHPFFTSSSQGNAVASPSSAPSTSASIFGTARPRTQSISPEVDALLRAGVALPATLSASRTEVPNTWFDNEVRHVVNTSGAVQPKFATNPALSRMTDAVRDSPRAGIQFVHERSLMVRLQRLYKNNFVVLAPIAAHVHMLAALCDVDISKTQDYTSPNLTVLLCGNRLLSEMWERQIPKPQSSSAGYVLGSANTAADFKPFPHPTTYDPSRLRGTNGPLAALDRKPNLNGTSGWQANAVAGPSSQATQSGPLSDALARLYDFASDSLAHLGNVGGAALGLGELPLAGRPGALIDPDEHDWGYEWDRPVSAEGFADLFRTALDDFFEDTSVDDALKELDLAKIDQRIPNLSVTLMPHQIIGVAWMVKQEKKTSCAGGVLADAMGLGKTIQTIATMVKNPSTDRKIRNTLIILPLPLLQQWKEEIELKSNLSVLIYHGPKRTKSINQLKAVDVVLTTYSIVGNEASGMIEPPKRRKKTDDFVDDDEEDEKPRLKQKGLLFKVHWYRCVLDEAAIIRNKSTKSHKACMLLNADIKWCLSGTLVYNNLTDTFAYLRFVGIISWEDFRERIHLIANRKPRLASKRVQAVLRKVMLRRTKDSTLNGKKILQLPPKTIDMVEMDFTDEERAIYAQIEADARVKVNKFFKAGTLLKNYSVVLVMLTRLRQLCCHPWLLRATNEYQDANAIPCLDVDEEDAIANGGVPSKPLTDEEEAVRAEQEQGPAWVDKIRKTLEDRYISMTEDRDYGEAEAEEDGFSCPICFEPLADERITACGHSYCRECIEGILTAPMRGDMDEAHDALFARHARPCPLCRSEVSRQTIYRASAFFDPTIYDDDDDESQAEEDADADAWDDMCEYDELEDDNDVKPDLSGKGKRRALGERKPSAKRRKLNKGKGKTDAKDEPKDEVLDGLGDVDIEDVEPSTKMQRVGAILENIRAIDPTQKTLVFSSFVELLELMRVYLRKKGIKHLLYTGRMKLPEREANLKAFSAEGGPEVLLMSLKAGAVGLNLTAASNVVMLDLAWSPATEAQAIDRSHRIGQNRPVTVKRLVIRDSVEQRILALQEKKQMLMDGAMGEGEGGRLPRLSARELVDLFGREDGHD